MVRILGGDAFRFALALGEHDVYSIGAIRGRPREEKPPQPVLIVQPFPMFFIIELFAFLFFRPRAREHDIPHVFVSFADSGIKGRNDDFLVSIPEPSPRRTNSIMYSCLSR